jgi:hypothetical protein
MVKAMAQEGRRDGVLFKQPNQPDLEKMNSDQCSIRNKDGNDET